MLLTTLSITIVFAVSISGHCVNGALSPILISKFWMLWKLVT